MNSNISFKITLLTIFSIFIFTNIKANIVIGNPTVLAGCSYDIGSNTFLSCEGETVIFTYIVSSSIGESINIDIGTSNLDAIFGPGNWTTFINSNPPFRVDSVEIFIQIAAGSPTPPLYGAYSNVNLGLVTANESSLINFVFVTPYSILTSSNQFFCANSSQSINLIASSNSATVSFQTSNWTQTSGISVVISNPTSAIASINAPALSLNDSLTFKCVRTTVLLGSQGIQCTTIDSITIYANLLASTGTDTQTACGSYTSPSGNYTWTVSNTYMDTIPNSVGCDSVITINLTVLPALTGTHNETVCFGGSIVVNGTTYDASNLTGTEVFTNIGAYGCDSTVAVTLTILPELTGTHNETVCFGSSIVVNGTTYDASNLTGTEVFTNISANNCDSTVVVTLTVENQIDVTTTINNFDITAIQTVANYRWLDCNNNNSVISGETGITYTAIANGDYAVEITVGNCVDTSFCVNISTVGFVNNILFKDVSIYPNPNQGIINIELGNLQDVSVKIFDTNGQLIYNKENINTSIFQFDLNTISGIYFIEISSNDLSQKYKLIIE